MLVSVQLAVLYFTLKGALIFNNLSAPISDSGVATVLKGIWQSLNYIIHYGYMFTLVTKWKKVYSLLYVI